MFDHRLHLIHPLHPMNNLSFFRPLLTITHHHHHQVRSSPPIHHHLLRQPQLSIQLLNHFYPQVFQLINQSFRHSILVIQQVQHRRNSSMMKQRFNRKKMAMSRLIIYLHQRIHFSAMVTKVRTAFFFVNHSSIRIHLRFCTNETINE